MYMGGIIYFNPLSAWQVGLLVMGFLSILMGLIKVSFFGFTHLIIWSKLQFTRSFPVPELLPIHLFNILVVSKLNFTIVLEVNASVCNFVKCIGIWSELVCRLHLIIAKLFLNLLRWGAHHCFLHRLEDCLWFLPHFWVSIENLAAPECWRYISWVFLAMIAREL